MKKLLTLLAVIISLSANAQINAVNDTTRITASPTFSPQFIPNIFNSGGVNYRVTYIYNPSTQKYDAVVYSKYLRRFYLAKNDSALFVTPYYFNHHQGIVQKAYIDSLNAAIFSQSHNYTAKQFFNLGIDINGTNLDMAGGVILNTGQIYIRDSNGATYQITKFPGTMQMGTTKYGFVLDSASNRIYSSGSGGIGPGIPYLIASDTSGFISSTSAIIHLLDSTAFATYAGSARVVTLRDTSVGGGNLFIKLPKAGNLSNAGTRFASNKTDSLWYRMFNKSEALSVQWWGAKGDGTTNETVNINRALATGKEIYFPRGATGVYMSDTLRYVQGSGIRGKNRYQVTIKQISTATALNWIAPKVTADVPDFSVKDITLDGNSANVSVRNYVLGALGRNIYVDNVSFINSYAAAIKLKNTKFATITNSSFDQMHEHGSSSGETSVAIEYGANGNDSLRVTNIKNNYFHAAAPSTIGKAAGGIILTVGSAYSQGVTNIADNLFDGIGQNYTSNFIGAIYEYNNTAVAHLKVMGNKIFNRRYSAITTLTEYDTDIEGNYVSGVDSVSASTAGAAYNLQVTSNVAAPTKSAYHFINNTAIDQRTTQALSIQGRAADPYYANNVTVTGFKALNCDKGVFMSYVSGVKFIDLWVENSATYGAEIQNSTGDITFDNATMKTTPIGVFARTSVSGVNLIFTHSHINTSTNYPITFRTGNAVIMDNNELVNGGANGLDLQTISTVKLTSNYGSSTAPVTTSSTNIFQLANSWQTAGTTSNMLDGTGAAVSALPTTVATTERAATATLTNKTLTTPALTDGGATAAMTVGSGSGLNFIGYSLSRGMVGYNGTNNNVSITASSAKGIEMYVNGTAGTLSSGTQAVGISSTGAVSLPVSVATPIATLTQNALATTTTDALLLTNTTAAAVGAQQISPSLHFSSNGWGTTAGTSQDVSYRINVLPVQAATPTGSLQFQSSINGGAYSNVFTVTSGGLIATSSSMQAGGSFMLNHSSIAVTSTDGLFLANNTASLVGTQAQWSPRSRWTGSAWNTTSTASNTMDAIAELQTSGGAVPSSKLAFGFQNIAAGGYTYPFSIDNSGNINPLSVNKVTITAPATSATLTIANGKTLTYNNSITISGTDATTMTFPSTSATIARTDAGNTFTGSQTVNGNVTLGTAGNKINITTGTNASVGTSTLVGGTVTVSTTAVTASSKIFLTDATTGALTNIGTPTVGTIVAGTSFVINSSNVLDTSNINWFIIN